MTDAVDIQRASNEAPPKKPGGITGKGFVKGDPRINRKGRPKSFDQLRALAQTLANEPALDAHGQQIVMDGHVVTNAEMLMRAMMRENPERFVEISYGKVPTPIELGNKDEKPITIKVINAIDDYRKLLAPIAPEARPVADSPASGEGEGAGDGAPVGQVNAGN